MSLNPRMRWAAALALSALTFCLVWTCFATDGAGQLYAQLNSAQFIDLDGNTFERRLTAFDAKVVVGPTGKPAFVAEMCRWTRAGDVADEPTPVLLNSHRGLDEPTFCPVCDRLVVPLNPQPIPGIVATAQSVPPTRAEWTAARKRP